MASLQEACTIIVPTRNRVHILKQCLESLRALTYPDVRIIVVNDASTDGTKNFLDQLQDPKITPLHQSIRRGVSEARNWGAQEASTNLIAYIDDDCVADADWLVQLLKPLADPTITFSFGTTLYVHKTYRGQFPEKVVTNSGGKWPGAGNMAFRKQPFLANGGFDLQYEHFHNEDTELAIRLVASGKSFTPTPAAIVYHQKSFWQPKHLLASAKNHAVFVLLKKRYPSTYRQFGGPVFCGHIIDVQDYFLLLSMPLLLPVVFVRYILRGKKDIGIFFIKWPLFLIVRRFWVYRFAIAHKVFML